MNQWWKLHFQKDFSLLKPKHWNDVLQIKKRRPRRTHAEMEQERASGMPIARMLSTEGTEEPDGLLKGKRKSYKMFRQV